MKLEKKDLLLYAVTDRSWLGTQTLYQQVEQALKGGVTFVQLREKHLDTTDFLVEARGIQALCRRYQVPFLINDRVDIARETDADGVHLGQGDMDAGKAREILGKDKILGVSARTVEQALRAQQQGADYLGVGAVFPTGTKADAQGIRHETLKEICQAVQIPVIAIGGIGPHNILRLSGSGICGVAVVSALFAADDITAAAAWLKGLAREMVAP